MIAIRLVERPLNYPNSLNGINSDGLATAFTLEAIHNQGGDWEAIPIIAIPPHKPPGS